VAAAVQAAIAERNRHDVALYAHVTSLYREMLSHAGDRVPRELEAIRSAKSLGAVASAYYLTASALRKAIGRIHSAL
jgi:hypothetical protein